MAKRRPKGTGTVRKRADGLWEGRIVLGYNPNGSPKIKYCYDRKQGALINKMRQIQIMIADGTYIEPAKITVAELAKLWLEPKKPIEGKPLTKGQIKPTTYASYDSNIRLYVVPTMGHMLIYKVTSYLVEGLLQDITASKSSSIARIVYTCQCGMFGKAKKEKMILHNPMEDVDRPSQEKASIQTMREDDIPKFIEAGRAYNAYPAFILAMAAGLREGEATPIKWGDIDFETGKLVINKQAQYRTGKGIEIVPYTKSDKDRVAYLPQWALQELSQCRKRQLQRRIAAGSKWEDHDYINTHNDGGLISPKDIYKQFKRCLRSAGLPEIRFHDLRHTYATLAVQEGAALNAVSKSLGHYSSSFTAGVYVHTTDKMQEDAAQKMDKLLSTLVVPH